MAQVICPCGRTHTENQAGKMVEVPNTVYVPSKSIRPIKVGGKNGQTIRPKVAVACWECSRDAQESSRVVHPAQSTPKTRRFEKAVRKHTRRLLKIEQRLAATEQAKAA